MRRDEQWLSATLAHTASADPFTGSLLKLAKAVRNKDGINRQHAVLGILRSDYMIDSREGRPRRLLQVELNTVASSFGSLATRLSELHRRASEQHGSAIAGAAHRRADVAGWCESSASTPLTVVAGATAPYPVKAGTVPVSGWSDGVLAATSGEGAGGLDGAVATTPADISAMDLPDNGSLAGLAASLGAGLREYSRQRAMAGTAIYSASPPASRPAVLMVVQPGERNFADQSLLADALLARHGVTTLRRTLAELSADAVLADTAEAAGSASSTTRWTCRTMPGSKTGLWKRRLFVRVSGAGGQSATDGKVGAAAAAAEAEVVANDAGTSGSGVWMEVGVVYFRAGYSPADFGSDDDDDDSTRWAARELLERSAAVKCPDLWLQLAGCKKVQQVLAQPGATERFLGAGEEARAVRACFAGLWSLDMAELDEPAQKEAAAAIERAIADPTGFVVKPQREGGGNNFFGSDVVTALTTWPKEQLGSYILMERIHPETSVAVMVREGEAVATPALCEFGVYTGVLGTGPPRSEPVASFVDATDGIAVNASFGHLVRTKAVGVDEGGVAAGFAVIDSPQLVGE